VSFPLDPADTREKKEKMIRLPAARLRASTVSVHADLDKRMNAAQKRQIVFSDGGLDASSENRSVRRPPLRDGSRFFGSLLNASNDAARRNIRRPVGVIHSLSSVSRVVPAVVGRLTLPRSPTDFRWNPYRLVPSASMIRALPFSSGVSGEQAALGF
jgi:hypothetical protein